MKIKDILRNKEGEASGGGSAFESIANAFDTGPTDSEPKIENRKLQSTESDDAEDQHESEDEVDDDASGVLAQMFEDSDDSEDESDDEQEDAESKEESSDDSEDDSADETDPFDSLLESIVSKDGKKITIESRQAIAKIKESRDKWKQKAEELEKNSQSPQSTEELEAIKADLQKYKTIVENEHFEQDPAFVKAYRDPIAKATKEIDKWLSRVPESETKEVTSILAKAYSIVNDEKRMAEDDAEVEYTEYVEKIADKLTPTAGAKLSRAMDEYFLSSKNYFEAKQNKEKAREILTKRRQEEVSKSRGSAEAMIDVAVSNWKSKNKARLDFYDTNKDRFKHTEAIVEMTSKAKKLLSAFYDTGVVSDELADFISHGGVGGEVLSRAESVYVDTITKQISLISDKDKKIKELESKLQKLSSRPKGSFSSSFADDSDDDSDEESGILATMREMRKS